MLVVFLNAQRPFGGIGGLWGPARTDHQRRVAPRRPRHAPVVAIANMHHEQHVTTQQPRRPESEHPQKPPPQRPAQVPRRAQSTTTPSTKYHDRPPPNPRQAHSITAVRVKCIIVKKTYRHLLNRSWSSGSRISPICDRSRVRVRALFFEPGAVATVPAHRPPNGRSAVRPVAAWCLKRGTHLRQPRRHDVWLQFDTHWRQLCAELC